MILGREAVAQQALQLRKPFQRMIEPTHRVPGMRQPPYF